MVFALKNIDVEGQLVTCLVREDGAFETVGLVNEMMNLAERDPEAYELVTEMIYTLIDRAPKPKSIRA